MATQNHTPGSDAEPAEWYTEKERIHKDYYDRLDELWTDVGDAWNIVDDAELSDDLGGLNDKFIEEGHYALTKATFAIDSAAGLKTLVELANDIYVRALRRNVEVWQRAADERLAVLKSELNKTLSNIAVNSDDEWQELEQAQAEYVQGKNNANEAKDDEARKAFRQAAEVAHSAIKAVRGKRARTSRRRVLTFVWQLLLLGVGIAGAVSLAITLL